LGTVRAFAEEAVTCGIPLRLQPAWLVSPTDGNRYNKSTHEILDHFSDLHVPVGDGNIIFPEGNAARYLSEYFTETVPENPYEEDPYDVRCISFSPNGEVLGGNAYRQDVMEIIEGYTPQRSLQ
jgi:hypothetical protein